MTTRRLYYDDSFERDFEARVLSCDRSVHNSAQAWNVVLDCTALYPDSGGQPCDFGKLDEANVVDVREEDEEIVHVVDRELEPGPVHGCVDWARRFDHMQQHTGQHLLSAMFQERYGRPTVSFHMGAEICTIDLRGPEPTDEIQEGAERAANEIIFQDRPVTVRYGTAEEFAELGVRKQVARTGILRAIEIEGADLQPCGGTHVKSTGQIGMILVRRTSKVRQDWRVEFVCGRRAARLAREDFLLLRRAAAQLNCAPGDVAAATERAVSERDANFKNSRGMLQRLADAEATLALQGISPDANARRVLARVFREDAEPDYLGFFATEIAKNERAVALLAGLSSGDLIFAQHPAAAADVNALLQQVLKQFGGKGGGTRDFARGRLSDARQCEKAILFAKENLPQ